MTQVGCILFPFELIFEGIIEGWFYLMQWFVPERVLRKGFRTALKIIVGIFTIILFLFMFLGIFALLSDDEYTNYIGKFMVFIPLGISVAQIILGIIVRCITKKK